MTLGYKDSNFITIFYQSSIVVRLFLISVFLYIISEPFYVLKYVLFFNKVFEKKKVAKIKEIRKSEFVTNFFSL